MILAATNKLAEAFGQTATHAPQPIQVAESNAQSASSLLTNCELASGAEPTDTEINPPDWIMRSNASRLTARSLTIGKLFALQGSIHHSL